MIKAIKILLTSLFGGFLSIYCTAFLWFETPSIFFKVIDLIAFFMLSVYSLLMVLKEMIKE